MRGREAPAVVVITGGTSGIGLATALLFARQGWHIGVISRGEAGLNAAECRLIKCGARVCVVAADVTDTAAIDAAAAEIAARLGPIKTWINAAGNGVFGRLGEVPPEEFDRVTATTYTGTVNGVRSALRHMEPGKAGSIVNVCSAIAFQGLPGLSSYAGAKAAVRGFTESVQSELKLAGSPIRLALVFPPAVNTPFFAHAVSYLPLPPRPAKPVYQPELVAQAVYLAATQPRDRLLVSFVTVAFDLGCRLAPGLTARAVRRLGYKGQMTDCPLALAARDPCLFEPSVAVAGVRASFPARSVSSQVWLARQSGLLRMVSLSALGWMAWRIFRVHRAPLSQATVPPGPAAP